MKKICGFGDAHFGDIQPWQLQAGDLFLDWLEKIDFGRYEETEAVFVGDIADSSVNAGRCTDQIVKLANILSKKFNTTYIVTGNHDKKKHKDIVQNAIKMMDQWENIHVIEDPTQLTTPLGFNCLLMPYTYSRYVSETYADWAATIKDKQVDIIAGHWTKADSDVAFTGTDFVDLSVYPPAKEYFIGHIHTRIDEQYTGSLWATKISEVKTPFPRGIKCLDETGAKSLIKLPKFVQFNEVNYPEKIKDSKDSFIHIYTVTNCNNLTAAKAFYKENYIRAVVRNTDFSNQETIQSDQNDLQVFKSMKDAFDSWIKESDVTVSRKLYKLVESLI